MLQQRNAFVLANLPFVALNQGSGFYFGQGKLLALSKPPRSNLQLSIPKRLDGDIAQIRTLKRLYIKFAGILPAD
jgi:hypothetical protein